MSADLLKGLALAVVTVAVAALLPAEARVPLVGVLLAMAAGVYPGFAMTEPASGERTLQWGVAVGFALVATLGVAFTPWWLAAGWVLHAAWDAVHHAGRRGSWVPVHYPMLCLSYDLGLAAYAAVIATGVVA